MHSVILFLCLFISKFREITFAQHNIQHPHSIRIRDNGGDALDGWVIAGTLAGVLSVIVAVVGAIIGFMQWWCSRDVSLGPHAVINNHCLIAVQRATVCMSYPGNHSAAGLLDIPRTDATIDDTHANGDIVSPLGMRHGPTKPSPAVLGRSTWPFYQARARLEGLPT